MEWRVTRAGKRALERASRDGDVDAMWRLGNAFADPDWSDGSVTPDRRTARDYFARAHRGGHRDATVRLADLLSEDRTVAGLAKARPLYAAAYRRGSFLAAYNLACTYQNVGRYREAAAWYRRAMRGPRADAAAIALARLELYGVGVRRRPQAAMRRLVAVAGARAADVHDRVEAMLVLARIYREGVPVRRDHDEARRWLAAAAKLGSATAAAMMTEE